MWANRDDVARQLRAAGLLVEAADLQLADGDKSRRCRVDGEGTEKRGWYRLHEWPIEPDVTLLVGSFGVFHGDNPGTFKVELTKRCASCSADVALRDKTCPSCGASQFKAREFSPEQKAAFKARVAEDKKRAAAEQAADAERASQWATAVWRASAEALPAGHGYLVRKQLSGTGGARVFPGIDGIILPGAEQDDYRYLGTFAGCLAVPLCDDNGKIYGLQFIADKRDPKTGRDKTYWPRGMVAAGHSWTIGGSPKRLGIVAEGFATALTLHEATGQPVTVAFAANNLLPVAHALNVRTRRRAKLLIAADDDWLQRCLACKAYTPVDTPTCSACGQPHRQTNAGRARAQEVAMAIDNAADFVPVFAVDRPSDRKGPTDFNDLACLEGRQVVTAQYEQRLAALKWQDAAAPPAPASLPPFDRTRAGGSIKGGGENQRRGARAIMELDDAVERFIPLDDGTGDYVFDTWTNKIAKRSQMIALLPAGVRGDDVKRHHLWVSRGAYYLDQVGFDPGGTDPAVQLNTWRGWQMTPRAGSCEHLLDLLEYLCSNDQNGRALAAWVLQWMAYPLQHPGAKMSSAIIMHGPQGTGKSTIFQTLAKIYGDYSTVLNQRGLEDKFNADWTDSKLFILAEEVVTRAEMWHIKGELKELVTGEWLRVNPKQIAAYRQRNQINMALLSNENQPLPLDNDDRRHCVIYTPPELSEQYYDAVHAELENGGIEAFYHYLLHLDTSDFHPKKRPPMTEAKQALILLSAASETRFVAAWLAGDLELPVCPCLATDLYAEYLRWCRANGEFKPRASNQFFGTLTNMQGWDKRKSRVYRDLNTTEAINRPVVTPPLAAMTAAGTAPPTGKADVLWLTSSVLNFNSASRLARPAGQEGIG